MQIKRFVRAGFFPIGIVALGCSHGSGGSSSSKSPPALVAPQPVTPAPAAGDVNEGVSDLARQTEQYAHQMTPLLQNQSPTPTTIPSAVQWIEQNPQASPDGSGPGSATPVNPNRTVANAAPVNPPQAIPPAQPKTEELSVPLILPESADMASSKSPPITTPVDISSDEYERKLQQEVHDYPRDVAGQLDYQLLRLVRDEPSPDLPSEAGMTAEDREIVSALVDGISNFRSTVRSDSNLRLSDKIQPLREMADRLSAQAELTIPTVALCTSVQSFGVYTPLPSVRLTAGAENAVIVYCEVANFTSVQDDQKMWSTRINEELILYNDTGMQVWPAKSNATVYKDMAHTRRHDFYIAREVKLPANLTIGRYLLHLSLTDELSNPANRVAETSTPIEIVAE